MQVIIYGVRGALHDQFVEALQAQFQAARKKVATYEFAEEASLLLAAARKAVRASPEKTAMASFLETVLMAPPGIAGYAAWRQVTPAQVHIVHGMLNPADFREVLYSESNNITICLRSVIEGNDLELVAVSHCRGVMDCAREGAFLSRSKQVRSHFDLADDCAQDEAILKAIVTACSR